MELGMEYWTFFVRWLHVLCGVMWIGLLWYFNFVQTPTVPTIPAPEPVATPTPAPGGIWPWPQSDAWDDATVRKTLRDAMESAKSGDIATSKRTLVRSAGTRH